MRLLLAILLCCALPTQAEVVLRTAPHLATPPKYYPITVDGKPAIGGTCMELFRALEKQAPELRIQIDATWMPTMRLESEMQAGHLDFLCGYSRTREREQRFLFVGPPLLPTRSYLVARAGDPVSVTSFEELRALGADGTVLVPTSFGSAERLRHFGITNIDDRSPDNFANLQKLVAGRGRFCYQRDPGLAALIRSAGLEGKVRILPTPFDNLWLEVMVGRHVPPVARERLAQALYKLEASGELKRLQQRWLEDSGPN